MAKKNLDYWYDGQVKRYLQQLIRIFSNFQVAENGLNTKFRNNTLLDIAKKLLIISKQGLNRRNILSSNKKYNEENYLLDIEKNISEGMSPSDYLLQKYHGVWKNSLDPIYSELIF